MKKEKAWQNKILISLLFIGALIYFSMSYKPTISKQETKSPKPQEVQSSIKIKASKSKEESQIDECLKKYHLSRSKEHVEKAWENIHFIKDGITYRLREFIDDGDNGNLVKLILFKEDEDGFPFIEQEWFREEVPIKKKEILKDVKIIHKEEAYSSFHGDSFFEITNNKINRLKISGREILPECSKN